jgi:hypothetical protein
MSKFDISTNQDHIRARDQLLAEIDEKIASYFDQLFNDNVGGQLGIAEHVAALLGGAAARVYVGEELDKDFEYGSLASLAGTSVPYYLEGFEIVAKNGVEKRGSSRKR